MRNETVTYDHFCQAILKMKEKGEGITVRAVHSYTGGSLNKISRYLKQWREEQAHAQSMTDNEISASLRQALFSEIGKAVNETKEKYEKRLAELSEQLDEAHENLSAQENIIDGYEKEAEKFKEELAVTRGIQAQQTEKMDLLEKKLTATVEAQHTADKRAAVAEARLEELQKQLLKIEETEKTKGSKKENAKS